MIHWRSDKEARPKTVMEQRCHDHPERMALSVCHSCGRHYCSVCLAAGAVYYYCRNQECRQALETEISERRPGGPLAKRMQFPHQWFWPIAITSMFVAGRAEALGDATLGFEKKREFAVLTLVALLTYAALLLMFTHHLWAGIQDNKTNLTPGRAVGFLFIPVFGLFWTWRVWASYAGAINAFRGRHNLPGRASKAITIAFNVIWFCAWILAWTPAAAFGYLILWIAGMVFVAHKPCGLNGNSRVRRRQLDAARGSGWRAISSFPGVRVTSWERSR